MNAGASHPKNPEIQSEARNVQSQPEMRAHPQRRAARPLVGLLAFSTILVAACTLPPYLLLRTRLGRVDGALSDVLHVARRADARHAQESAEVVGQIHRMGQTFEVLQGQVDRVAGDVRDVRSVLLKERAKLATLETRFDGLSEQLKAQEHRVLSGLATEQKGRSKTENEITELRKTADQNANNLSNVAVSLADIANLIEQAEIEHGKVDTSKRVNALRDSALGVWQSIYKHASK